MRVVLLITRTIFRQIYEQIFVYFQMETSAQEVHENLNSIVDYQTHHRLRETQVSFNLINFHAPLQNLGRINFLTKNPKNICPHSILLPNGLWNFNILIFFLGSKEGRGSERENHGMVCFRNSRNLRSRVWSNYGVKILLLRKETLTDVWLSLMLSNSVYISDQKGLYYARDIY